MSNESPLISTPSWLLSMSLKAKLILLLMLVGGLPMAISSGMAFFQASSLMDNAESESATALEDRIRSTLVAVGDLKKDGVENCFETIHG
jgi:hypothetical protein